MQASPKDRPGASLGTPLERGQECWLHRDSAHWLPMARAPGSSSHSQGWKGEQGEKREVRLFKSFLAEVVNRLLPLPWPVL